MKYGKSLIKILPFCLVLVLGCFSLAHASDSNKLLVGLNPEYKPLVYKEDGKLTGIEPATATALGKLLNKKIVFKEYAWAELIPALESGAVDVIMSGMSITAERSQRIAFTQPYLEIGQMAIIRKDDIGRLSQPRAMFKAGVRIGVEPGTTGEQYVEGAVRGAEILSYKTPQQAFRALQAGEIDFFVHDAPTSWNLAQGSDWPNLMALYAPLTKESIAWAVNKNNTPLLDTLNKALVKLQASGAINQIQYHWIPVKIEVLR
ncbi:MAG: transporter substrate-binding domain-containing protein [Porticoccaceae bacterium]|nr:transporter substrate-binding domain-containing protein [Porticoccaceae bacterium]